MNDSTNTGTWPLSFATIHKCIAAPCTSQTHNLAAHRYPHDLTITNYSFTSYSGYKHPMHYLAIGTYVS